MSLTTLKKKTTKTSLYRCVHPLNAHLNTSIQSFLTIKKLKIHLQDTSHKFHTKLVQ